MIKFSYGDDSHSIDVTEKAKSQFVINDTLRITKDINFNKLFGDPVPLKVKKLTATFDDQTTVVFPEQRQKSYTVELLKSKPKTIVQYWNGSSGESMPAWAVANTEAIKFYHRDFDYKLFDRKSAIQFIRRHFHTNVLVAFCKCAIPLTSTRATEPISCTVRDSLRFSGAVNILGAFSVICLRNKIKK